MGQSASAAPSSYQSTGAGAQSKNSSRWISVGTSCITFAGSVLCIINLALRLQRDTRTSSYPLMATHSHLTLSQDSHPPASPIWLHAKLPPHSTPYLLNKFAFRSIRAETHKVAGTHHPPCALVPARGACHTQKSSPLAGTQH